MQSQRKREYDFDTGTISDYAIIGGVFAVLFVVAAITVVQECATRRSCYDI